MRLQGEVRNWFGRALAVATFGAIVPSCAVAAAAATYHVRPDGSDSACSGRVNAANPGSGAAPRPCAFRTPQKGVDTSAGGDTVLVHAGTYAVAGTPVQSSTDIVGINLRSDLVSDATRLTIAAAAGEVVTFDGGGLLASGVTIWGTSYVTVDGIAFQNFTADKSPAMEYGAAGVNVGSPGPDNPSSRIVLSNLQVSGSTLGHLTGPNAEIAIWCAECANNVIDGCRITSVEPSAIAVGNPSGSAVEQRGTISNTSIFHPRDQQIWTGIFGDHTNVWRVEGNYFEETSSGNTTTDQLRVEDSTGWEILDNVFYKTTRNAINLVDNGLDGSQDEAHLVLNNTVDCGLGLGRGVRLSACNACEVRNNIIVGCPSAVVLAGNGSFSELGFNGFFQFQDPSPYNTSSEFGFNYQLVGHDLVQDTLFEGTPPRPDPFYRLTDSSPMIDMGDNAFCADTPADGQCDMGAFQAGASGADRAPERPSIVLVDKLTGRSARLNGSAFVDPDAGDTHIASQWQVDLTTGDFSNPIADSGVVSDISTAAPQFRLGGLRATTTYKSRVRYRDNHGVWSQWSDPAIDTEDEFTTLVATAIPPVVVSVNPTRGATGVTIPTTATLHFNVPVDPATVTAATVKLVLSGTAVAQAPGSPSVDGSGQVVTVTPAGLLSPGFRYRIVVLGGDGGVHSRDGSVPGVSFASGFTTETGLASSDPAQGATGVATSVAPQLTFKWAVDPASVSATTVTLRDVTAGKLVVLASVTTSGGGLTVILTPAAALKPNHRHAVTILSGASGLKLADGRLLGKRIKVLFKTGAS